MVVYIYLFDSKWAGHADNILQAMMRPFSWTCNKLPSCFKRTTKEVKNEKNIADCDIYAGLQIEIAK